MGVLASTRPTAPGAAAVLSMLPVLYAEGESELLARANSGRFDSKVQLNCEASAVTRCGRR